MEYTGQSSGWDDVVFVYDGFMMIEERNLDSSGDLLRRYYYEDGINKLAFIHDKVEDANYGAIIDDRGTLMGLADADSAAIIEKLYYNSTGLCKAYDASDTAKTSSGYNISRSEFVPFGYLGMYHDPFTGKYHTHFREFDPVHNRWLTEDPAGYNDGLSLYAAYMGVNGTDVLGLKARKKYVIRGLHQTYEGAGISKPQEVYGFNVPVLDAMGGLDIRFEDKIPVAELIQTARGQFFKEDLKKAVKQAIETPLMIASIANAGRKGVVVTLTKSANLIMQVINVLQSDNPDLEILKYVIGNGQGKILDKFFGDEYIMFSETINQILTKKESEITDDTLKRIRGELGELFDGVEIWKSPQFRKRSFLGIPLRTRNNKVDVTIIYNKKTDVVITAVGCSTMEDRYMFNRIISIYGIHGKDAGRSKEGYYDENHPFGNMQAWYELDLEYYEELKNEKDN